MKQRLGPIRAVIFDMDGVLFFSTNCHERAFNDALATVGQPPYPYHQIAGRRTQESFRKIFSERGLKLTPTLEAKLVAAKQARVRQLLPKDSRVAGYCDELLLALHERYRLAIASSASRATIDIFLAKTAQSTLFEAVLDGSHVQASKPAPDIYLLAAATLSEQPNHCVVIEDAASGVAAGVAAGMTVIGITGTDSSAALKRAGATWIVQGLQEIESILLQKKPR